MLPPRRFSAVRFVVLAADAQVARSILLYKSNMDKIGHLAENKALACAGPQSDCVAFTEYIAKNMTLHELNNNVTLTTKAAATYIRGEVRYVSCYAVRLAERCVVLESLIMCVVSSRWIHALFRAGTSGAR